MIARESALTTKSVMPKPPAILIVEDEIILAKDLQRTLIDFGYDAFAIASSAEAAVRCADERRPDLVMMDIRIKGPLDGIHTANILKEKFSTAIIYLTAHADKAMIERAKETEPHGYLLKPVGIVELRSAVEIALYRHQLEQARAEKAELEHRMTEELRENNQQLERSNRDLEDFAYIASHDLKTPLNGIKSAALWLEEDLRDLSDESRTILGLMRSRITRMETLLDDLLAFSRVGRTETVASDTNVADIFAGIVEVLDPPAHIRVRSEGELPMINTASAQLEQVLRNLINNAIKHHDKPNGEVVLSAERMGNFVEFVVRDDGPGIPPQYHEKIFQLFQTLKRRDDVESTGMGLAIVKKLVERQNCRITVHSEGDGTGTMFRFRWPTSTSAGAPAAGVVS